MTWAEWVLAITICTGIGSWIGYEKGTSDEHSRQDSVELVAAKAAEATDKGHADRIADLAIKLQPVTNTIYHEIRLQPVYTTCKHTPDAFKALQEAANATN